MLDWDHNAYYQARLLRELPSSCRRVMDVGCGAGAFAARLAQYSEMVDAVDRCAPMIELAKRSTPSNVNCVLADVLSGPPPGRDYDAIVSICALHHMELREILPGLAAALRPGGVLAAIALPRRDLIRELPFEAVASVGHRVFGAAFLAKRTLGLESAFVKEPSHAQMPVVLDPPLTTREVAHQAAEVLPGVRVRRLVFWRYLLVWHKPLGASTGDTTDR